MVSRMKPSVASCFMSRSSVDSNKLSCTVTIPTQRHDDGLAARELADARGPHLHIDLSLQHPCAVSAGAGKGRRWSTVRCWSHRHTISLAEAGGTAADNTWTGDGKRRQVGKIVGFTQALNLHSRRRGLVSWCPEQHLYPHTSRSEPSSS